MDEHAMQLVLERNTVIKQIEAMAFKQLFAYAYAKS